MAARKAPTDPDPAWDGVERRSGEDRRKRRHFRFIDHRTGFDRRRHTFPLSIMRERPWLLLVVLAILNVLSFADGVFTAAELGLGIAREGNPILGVAVNMGPRVAIPLKLSLIPLVSIGIWLGRKRRVMLVLALLAMALFTGVVAYHVAYLHTWGYL